MIENARSEREMAALMQEAVDCLPNGFSILDENLLPIMANQVCRTSFPSFYQAAVNGLTYREASFSIVRQAMPDAPLEEILRILDRFAPAARVSQEDLNSLFSTMDVPRKAAVRTR